MRKLDKRYKKLIKKILILSTLLQKSYKNTSRASFLHKDLQWICSVETEKTICLPDEDLNRIIDGYCQRLQFHLLAVIFWIVCGILLAFHHFISIDPTHFRTPNFSPKKFNVCENELSRLYQLFHLIFLWFSTDITAPAKSPDLLCICFRTTF